MTRAILLPLFVILAKGETSAFGDHLQSDFPIYDVPLDRDDTCHLYWKVDYEAEEVHIEVHWRDVPGHPWMAVGFSDYGEWQGGDMCAIWTDWKGQVKYESVLVDEGLRFTASNDKNTCFSFKQKFEGDVVKFAFSRKFDACIPGHYVIERGTTHVLWTTGEGPLYQLQGVLANGDESGMVRVELLKPLLDEADLDTEDVQILEIITKETEIQPVETLYWCSVHKLPDEFSHKHHIVQFGPKIQVSSQGIVHHMEVFHCEYPADIEVPRYQGPCHAPDREPMIDACKRVLAAWAMGAIPFKYLPETGLPIGGHDFNPYVMLEVHYNNPELITGKIDNSGIALHYTSKLRKYDAGIMELGMEYTPKMAIPPQMPAFFISGYCIPECTEVGIPPEGIFIFGSQLHTHLNGLKVWTSHIRGGVQLPDLNRDNHYSTHFQEIRRLPKPVHILPGDALINTCHYSTMQRSNVTLGGFSIRDEMCVNYVHYYPKIDLEVCKSSIDSQTLIDYFNFMNKWENQPTSPDFSWRQNFQAIKYTPLRSTLLHDLIHEASISMQCNKSSGDRFPGYWENMPIPMVTHPLPPPERKCFLKKENDS